MNPCSNSQRLTLACGGEGFGPGYFVKPTVTLDIDQRHRLVQEEIFGPVLVAMPFDDLDESRSNMTQKAL